MSANSTTSPSLFPGPPASPAEFLAVATSPQMNAILTTAMCLVVVLVGGLGLLKARQLWLQGEAERRANAARFRGRKGKGFSGKEIESLGSTFKFCGSGRAVDQSGGAKTGGGGGVGLGGRREGEGGGGGKDEECVVGKESDCVEEGWECVVCLGEFEEGEDLRRLDACGHFFHRSCVDAWLAGHTFCPYCRASLGREALGEPAADQDQERGVTESQEVTALETEAESRGSQQNVEPEGASEVHVVDVDSAVALCSGSGLAETQDLA